MPKCFCLIVTLGHIQALLQVKLTHSPTAMLCILLRQLQDSNGVRCFAVNPYHWGMSPAHERCLPRAGSGRSTSPKVHGQHLLGSADVLRPSMMMFLLACVLPGRQKQTRQAHLALTLTPAQ